MGFFEFFAAVLAFLYGLVHDYGLAIILLTLLVRVVLLPLSIKQTRSMREMQRLQPEIKKLQKKYKNNRQKLNEEMMALYREHNANPFGGCLPLVMQFPVFIALYRVVRTPLAYLTHLGGISLSTMALAVDLRQHPVATNHFLGVFRLDCTPSEVLSGAPSTTGQAACGGGVVSVIPYVILVLLMGATTYYQQKQLQATQPAVNQQQQQMLLRIMPLVLMFFSFTFPTGLTLYWLTSNVWTVFQQRKVLGPMIARDEEAARARAAAKVEAERAAGTVEERPARQSGGSPRGKPASGKGSGGGKSGKGSGGKPSAKAVAGSGGSRSASSRSRSSKKKRR